MQWYASRNREGKTPTELALLKGHHEVAAVLRKFGGEDPTQVEQVRSEFKGYVFATERIGDDNRPSPDENLVAPGTSEENDCSMQGRASGVLEMVELDDSLSGTIFC